MNISSNINSLFQIYSNLTYYRVELIENSNDFYLWLVEKGFIRDKLTEHILIPKNDTVDNSDLEESICKYDPIIIDVYSKRFNKGYKKDLYSFFNHLFQIQDVNYYLENILESKILKKNYQSRYLSVFSSPKPLDFIDKTAVKTLLNWANKSSREPLLILGNRGIGKTWLLKRFCNIQLQEFRENPFATPFPLYINIGDLSRDIQNIDVLGDMISKTFLKSYGISINDSGTFLEALITNENVILVLDGLDEMSFQYNHEILQRNIWQIFLLLRKSNSIILSSRTGLFSSFEEIYKYFAFYKYKDIKPTNPEYIQELYKVYNDFSILELAPLKIRKEKIDNIELNEINKYYINGQKKFNRILDKYSKINFSIQYEILDLVAIIPGAKDILFILLGANKLSFYEIYYELLKTEIVGYNIQNHRAMKRIQLLKGNKYISYNVDEKIQILSTLAWYLYDRNIQYFSISELQAFFLNTKKWDYESVIEDLKLQTVITVDDDKLRFISDGVQAFFISYFIQYLISSPLESQDKINGLRIIGSYNFNINSIGKRVLNFIKELLISNDIFKQNIIQHFNEHFNQKSELSQTFKYFQSNLSSYIDVEIPKISNKPFWDLSDEANNFAKDQNIDLILIPKAKNNTNPFFFASTEITNFQFQYFLNYKKRPKYFGNGRLGIIDFEYFDKRSKLKRKCKTTFLPSLWTRESITSNPYKDLKNEYYLIDWNDNNTPQSIKKHHPVVWVSWFAAAQYCNWLSIISGFEPYYIFELNENKSFNSVRINVNNEGFRLPSEREWKIVASELGINKKYVWDKHMVNGELSKQGIMLKDRLERERNESYPIKSEDPNSLGVYGMMGNVREWVDEYNNLVITEKEHQVFKGAAWLTNKLGLDFTKSFKILAQNTNPDIGFRIVRSISLKEKSLIN